jgi:hypothetical protein
MSLVRSIGVVAYLDIDPAKFGPIFKGKVETQTASSSFIYGIFCFDPVMWLLALELLYEAPKHILIS